MHTPIPVNGQTFGQEVLEASNPVLADFWAAWCGPCRMLAPIVDEIAREHGDVLKVVKIDIDENPELARFCNILSIPTLGVFHNGELIDRVVGYVPKAELVRRLTATGVLGGVQKDRQMRRAPAEPIAGAH